MAEVENKEGQNATPPPTQEQQEIAAIQKAIDSGSFKLPDKFKDAEAFYNSHKNLEAHATRLAQENAELKKVKDEKKETPPVDDLASALEQDTANQTDGIDWPKVEKELQTTGDISKETREKLTAAKIPASMIEAQVAAHKAKKAADAKAAADLVGGQDNLKAVLDWGKQNLSAADAAVVQEQLRGPGWKLALLGLAKMAQAGQTNEPGSVETSNGIPGGVQPYSNQAEMTKDMRDPRYVNRTDPKFVQLVEARVWATSKAAKAAR